MTGHFKLSLHRDNNCHLSFQRNEWKGLRAEGYRVPSSRKANAWRRLETPNVSILHVVSVLFPRDFLRIDEFGSDRQDNSWWSGSIFYFAHAPHGQAVEFGFFFTREAPEIAERKLSSSVSGTRSTSVTFGIGEAACISLIFVQPTPSPERRNLMSLLSFRILAASKTDAGSCVNPALPDIATMKLPPQRRR